MALALGLAAFGATARAAESLVVLTWNVENYVAENRLVDGTYRTDYPKPEKAKAALRAVVRAVKPDVLALQEMGPEPYLEELQRDLATEGLAFTQRVVVHGPDLDRHIALLARTPLVRMQEHARVPLRGNAKDGEVRRGVLEAVVRVGASDVALFIVHLKSRHTEKPDDLSANNQRAAEAEAVRDLVLRRHPTPTTASFVIVGDCNDAPRSRPLRALQRRGQTEIARLLPAVDSRGETWTHFYREEELYSRFDYALVSPGLTAAGIVARAEIVDLPEVRLASDHRPVLLRLMSAAAVPSPGDQR